MAPERQVPAQIAAASEGAAPENPAVWALGERRFAHHFAPLDGGAPAPAPLSAYLDLPAGGRGGKTPWIDGPAGRLSVSGELVRACDDLRTGRELLDRLAAPVAALAEPEPVRSPEGPPAVAPVAVLTALEARHRSEVASIAASYEARLAAQRREVEAEAARRVHRRLLALLAPAGTPAAGVATGGRGGIDGRPLPTQPPLSSTSPPAPPRPTGEIPS